MKMHCVILAAMFATSSVLAADNPTTPLAPEAREIIVAYCKSAEVTPIVGRYGGGGDMSGYQTAAGEQFKKALTAATGHADLMTALKALRSAEIASQNGSRTTADAVAKASADVKVELELTQ